MSRRATPSDPAPPEGLFDALPAVETTAEKPHHLGHRQRLRERLLAAGAGALPDYELLEFLLYAAFQRGDVKPLAKDLIERFGSLAEVLSADAAALRAVPGAGDAA